MRLEVKVLVTSRLGNSSSLRCSNGLEGCVVWAFYAQKSVNSIFLQIALSVNCFCRIVETRTEKLYNMCSYLLTDLILLAGINLKGFSVHVSKAY